MDNGKNYQLSIANYQLMKDSGAEWLGDIPTHWETKRTKWIFREVDERSPKGEEELLSVSNYTGVTPRSEKNVTMIMAADYSGYKLCKKDDLVINIMWAWMGALGISPMEGIVSSSYGVYRFWNEAPHCSRYYDYLVRIKDLVAEYNRHSKGIHTSRLRMYSDNFFDIVLPLPPVAEQTAIANFLDRKTGQIDAFVALKEKTIALLEEQKTALINRAVTQGLNPAAPLKDSGIEWLGEIPAHWEVRKLKYVAKVKTGKTPSIEKATTDYFNEGDVDWFTPGDFNSNGILSNSNRKVSRRAITDGQVVLFKPNSLFLIGIGGTLGKIGISFNAASANQQINIISFNNELVPLFGFYFYRGKKEMILNEADFTTLPILNQTKTKSLLIAIPPLSEQHQIVAHIEQATAKIDRAIAQAQQQIELIKEYRESLISQAVTGKIRVIDN